MMCNAIVYKDNIVLGTQKTMSMLFDCSTDNNIKKVFAFCGLKAVLVTEKISATA